MAPQNAVANTVANNCPGTTDNAATQPMKTGRRVRKGLVSGAFLDSTGEMDAILAILAVGTGSSGMMISFLQDGQATVRP